MIVVTSSDHNYDFTKAACSVKWPQAQENAYLELPALGSWTKPAIEEPLVEATPLSTQAASAELRHGAHLCRPSCTTGWLTTMVLP